MFTRRSVLLSFSALIPLAACTTTTDPVTNITTVTINTAQIDAYGRVGVSAVSTVLSIAAVASAIGAPTIVTINTASAAVLEALAAFDKATGGSASFTMDNSTAVAAAKSVVDAIADLLSKLKGAEDAIAPNIGTNDMANVRTIVNAVETSLALAQALLGFVSAGPNSPKALMPTADMFRAVNLPVPAWAA
ncbi:MAG: hypothetical protein P4L77_13080 [Sulfuriferula sp.]|nr:hypothetical protein [Sulfuriferula sp.]